MLFPLSVSATDTCPAGYYPAEYVELEYIKSTGTQWIDFNYRISAGISFKAIVEVEIKSGGVYSFYQDWSGNFILLDSNGIRIGGTSTQYMPYDGTRKRLVLNMESDGVHCSLTDGVNTIQFTKPVARYPYSSESYINTIGRVYDKMGQAIYYRIQQFEDGIKVRDFIPVRRISDGAVGMYDMVEDKFYGNDGTGEFIAGPVVGDTQTTQHHICVSCPANTYKPNTGNESCTKCPTGTFSPIGSTQLSDCAKILRVKDYVVYMPLGKRTEHGLCVMSDGKKYCADVYERQ